METSKGASMMEEIMEEIVTYDTITVLNMGDTYFFDPPIDEIYSLTPEETLDILDKVSEEGYFKKDVISGYYCNECFSTDFVIEYVCPRCSSPRIIKDRIFVHKCGYRGVKKAFISGDELRCPKCGQKLHREGADYLDEGVKHKCIACGNIFDNPLKIYKCTSCGAKYYGTPPEMYILKYTKLKS